MLILTQLPLFFHYQRVPILQGILRSSLKILRNLRPFLQPIIRLYKLQQSHILIQLPWPLLQLWAQVTCPVLSALFSVTVHFVIIQVEFVQLLGDLFPVVDLTVVLKAFVVTITDDLAQEAALVLAPAVVG